MPTRIDHCVVLQVRPLDRGGPICKFALPRRLTLQRAAAEAAQSMKLWREKTIYTFALLPSVDRRGSYRFGPMDPSVGLDVSGLVDMDEVQLIALPFKKEQAEVVEIFEAGRLQENV